MNEHTHPEVLEFIMKGLTGLRKQKEYSCTQEAPEWKMVNNRISMMNFMAGVISQQMVSLQNAYYRQLGSRKGGVQWAGKVILKTWGILHAMWIGRNEVLHQKATINSLSGEHLLDVVVEQEYELGCEGLPETMHKWFRKSKEQLLNESVEYKKGWLLLVKSVKESLQIAEYNIFSSSRTLRRWIGLSPNR